MGRRPDGVSPLRYEGEIVADNETVRAAVYGGCILGGGGGGWVDDGLARGSLAVSLGKVRIVPIDSVDQESVVVTASAVGAPGSKNRYVLPIYYVKAVEQLVESCGITPDALVTNENGASATVNGWMQAAALGIPVLDAPCDGRAHPTAAMGSCGLWFLEGYESIQSAVGGDPARGMHLEMVARGSFKTCATMVRQSAIQAGGLVAVARDPVPASFLKKNAACGGIMQAITLGREFLAGLERGPSQAVEAVCECLGASVVYAGSVTSVDMEMRGGFDVGTIRLDAGACEITFWNEYMTLEVDGERKATFPDLVIVFDQDGRPLISAAVRPGQRVTIARAPKDRLILGAGMKDPRYYEDAERAVGKEIIRYSFAQMTMGVLGRA